jgi:triosephosphate isomerase
MKKKYTIVANWKMYWDFAQTMQFLKDNSEKLITLGNKTGNDIIVCPSFTALFSVARSLQESLIKVGAQDCSSYQKGAFTGQISAQDIASVGCSHCIIGHSERRALCDENSEAIAKKCLALLEHELQPIICVGETKDEHIEGKTYEILHAQIMPVLSAIKGRNGEANTLMIAYEPIWSIGTGLVPDNNHIESVLTHIKRLCDEIVPHVTVLLLYGGSVSSKTIVQFLSNPRIDGFLIGGSSLDFIEFSTILLSCWRVIPQIDGGPKK